MSSRSDKPRVIYRLEQATPYFVERFNTIARRGNIAFEGWFDAERWADRSWDVVPEEWEFAGRFVQPTRLGPAKLIRQASPDVYLSPYWSISYHASLVAAKSVGAKTVLRVLKTYETWVKRTRKKELAKHIVFRFVDAIHTSGPDGVEYARRYGARKTFAFPEPIDVERFRAGSEAVRSDSKAREALGLEGCVFLYVGRMWKSKGIDHLLEAFRRVRSDGIDASLLLVGDGVDEARFRERAAPIPGVVFTGFVQQSELPRYYGLSDTFVFPTLGDPYGHVVHEAMASSLPVISTGNAGDIRDRVIEGQSGFIVPAGESQTLYERMRRLALDAQLREVMGRKGYEIVAPRNLNWWAESFEQMVMSLAEEGRKRPSMYIPARDREEGRAE